MRMAYLMAGSVALLGASAVQAEAGDIFLRGRAIIVSPNEDSGTIQPTFPNERVEVTDSFAPEIDLTYMISDHIGIEVIAATTEHEFRGTTGTTATIGELGSTWVLPPTVTLQYHFAPEARVRPYVGAGVNYTLFYSEDPSSGLENAVGPTDVSLSDSWGFALQAGVDIDLNDSLFLNFDVKYIDIDTNARLDTTAIGTQRVGVDLNPFVVGIGLGIRL